MLQGLRVQCYKPSNAEMPDIDSIIDVETVRALTKTMTVWSYVHARTVQLTFLMLFACSAAAGGGR